MLKLQTTKPTVLAAFLIAVLVLTASYVIVALNNTQSVGAQASQQPRIDLNQAAEDKCGAGAVGPGTTDSACRFGFRAGYNGEAVATACASTNHNPNYTNAQVSACKNGHAAGKTYKATGTFPGASGAGTASTAPFFGPNEGANTCGSGPNAIKTKFNFGCRGQGNPIFDVLFAIIRFLTFGVGIAVTIAIIMSGIQYTTSEGNPEKTMAAKQHIQNALIALMIYIFSFALLNYLIPGGLLS